MTGANANDVSNGARSDAVLKQTALIDQLLASRIKMKVTG
jgi:hypothetical protein